MRREMDGQVRRPVALWGGIALSVVLSLWTTAAVWGPELPPGDDVTAHLVRARFAFDHILGAGRLDGWFTRFMVGHQEFLFYGPGFTWFVGLLRAATFGALSTAGATKAGGILTLAAFGPAAAFLTRAIGFDDRAAGAAAVLAVGVDSVFGVGLRSVYVIGLLPHQLAAVLFLVGLGALALVVTEDGAHWIALAAVSLAALAITHLISAVILAVIAPLILPTRLLARGRVPARRAVVRAGAAGVAAVGLAAFWLVPLLAHRDLRGPVTTWATPPIGERINAIAQGRILFTPVLAWLVAISIGALLVYAAARRQFAVALLGGTPVVYLVLAHTAASQWRGHEVTLQLANRGLGYAGVLGVVAVAVAASLAVGRRGGLASLAVLGASVAVAASATAPGRATADNQREPVAALRSIAGSLADRMPEGGRFATERDFPGEIARSGVSHPDHWLVWRSNRDTLNIFNAESSPSRAGFSAERLGDTAPVPLAQDLRRYGVTHVVTVTPETAGRLSASPLFDPVDVAGPFVLFELAGPTGPLGGATARVVRAEPESISLVAQRPATGDVAAAVSWSPKWHVRVDGELVPTTPTADGLVGFELPDGRSRVALEWRRDSWDRLGGALSVLTAALLGGYFVSSLSLMSRRRSRTA